MFGKVKYIIEVVNIQVSHNLNVFILFDELDPSFP